MSTVFKRGDVWYARFAKDGRVVVKSTKETEKEKAERMLQELITMYGDTEESGSKVEMEKQVEEFEKKPRKRRRAVPKLVKLNGIWYIRTRKDGRYTFKSTKQKDKTSAEKIFQQFVDTGEMPIIPRRVSVQTESLVEAFRRDIISYLKLINKQLENLNKKFERTEKLAELCLSVLKSTKSSDETAGLLDSEYTQTSD